MIRPSPDAIRAIFHQEVPDQLLLDTGRCLLAAYRDAGMYARENYPGEEAHDVYPHLRRAMFERNWRAMMTRRPKVTADVMRNEAGNCFHTRVTVGRVVLTASAVEAPNSLVRDAVFRKTLAESSQHHLFRERSLPPPDALLYAIILHGPTGVGILRAPGFIRVAFPSNELDSYVTSVDVVQHLPALAAELQATPSEPTASRVKPRLRKGVRQVGEGD